MFFNRIFNICMSLNNIETSVRRLITLIKSNFDMLEYLNNIEIHVYHSILNKTLCSIIIFVLHLVEEHGSMTCNHEV